MTDYTPVTNFTAKDAAHSAVLGSEIHGELDLIKAALDSKADFLSIAFQPHSVPNGQTTFQNPANHDVYTSGETGFNPFSFAVGYGNGVVDLGTVVMSSNQNLNLNLAQGNFFFVRGNWSSNANSFVLQNPTNSRVGQPIYICVLNVGSGAPDVALVPGGAGVLTSVYNGSILVGTGPANNGNLYSVVYDGVNWFLALERNQIVRV